MNVTHSSQLGTIEIKKYADPSEAPNAQIGGYKGIALKNVAVVDNGTAKGNATVDLVLEDEHGQKYVVMIMGSFVHALKSVVGDIV